MIVDTAATTTPTRAVAPPGDHLPPPPGGAGALPTRRALLGLLATAGATAAAAQLSGPLVDRLTAGPSRLDPASVLRISVTGLTTEVDRAAAAAAHGDHPPEPDGAAPAGAVTDALGARVWSRLVTVTLVVRNTAAAEVLFSPGQVRLRLADGTGVMPVETERSAGAVAALTTVQTWVRFLAPQDGSAVTVDYTPAGATEPVPLPVPPPVPAAAAHRQEEPR